MIICNLFFTNYPTSLYNLHIDTVVKEIKLKRNRNRFWLGRKFQIIHFQ
jgi:hypothetical protein